LKIRFQADADLNGNIVRGVRLQEPSIDFQTPEAAGLVGLPDPLVVERAALEGRILVSHDKRTMITHFGEFVASGRDSPGLFIVTQQSPIGAAIDDLVLIWHASDPDEWRNRFVYVPLHY
jgi:hypothetical protein